MNSQTAAGLRATIFAEESAKSAVARVPAAHGSDPEVKMIHVTSKAAAYIVEHGGNLTLYSKTLSG